MVSLNYQFSLTSCHYIHGDRGTQTKDPRSWSHSGEMPARSRWCLCHQKGICAVRGGVTLLIIFLKWPKTTRKWYIGITSSLHTSTLAVFFICTIHAILSAITNLVHCNTFIVTLKLIRQAIAVFFVRPVTTSIIDPITA